MNYLIAFIYKLEGHITPNFRTTTMYLDKPIRSNNDLANIVNTLNERADKYEDIVILSFSKFEKESEKDV